MRNVTFDLDDQVAVPESVPRSKIAEVVQLLGMDPNDVYELTIRPHAVVVMVALKTIDGASVSHPDGNGVLKTSCVIRIAEGDDAS